MASCLAVNNRRSIAQCKLSVCVCVHLLRQPNSAAMQSYLQMPSAPAADEPLKTGSLHSARVFVVSKSVRVLLKRFIGLPSSVCWAKFCRLWSTDDSLPGPCRAPSSSETLHGELGLEYPWQP